jgi:hypothetical protein
MSKRQAKSIRPKPSVVWQPNATQKLLAFLSDKADTSNVQVRAWDVSATPLKNNAVFQHSPTCWWTQVAGRNEAYAVCTLPTKPGWYNRTHPVTLPSWEHATTLVAFAVVRDMGVPVLQPMLGFCGATWAVDQQLQILHLEEGSSNAIGRQHQHWAHFAMAAWLSELNGATTMIVDGGKSGAKTKRA